MKDPKVLRYQKDFDKLRKKGSGAGSKLVVLVSAPNGLSYSRHAFLASKKIGGAVARNRARRLMRENFAALEDKVSGGRDILIIAKKEISEAKSDDVGRSLYSAMKKGGVIG